MLHATVSFARLLLGAIFLANLASWVVRYSGVGQFGTILAIAAIGAAWYSQERFYHSEEWLKLHHVQTQPGFAGVQNPNAWSLYEADHRTGTIARWLCVLAAALAFLCILLGP
jgi:hypothetical protein